MDKKIKIIGFGDSITYGDQNPKVNWCKISEELINNTSHWDVEIINKGINGNTTCNGLDRFEEDVISSPPNIIVIEFGINDSNYRPWAKVPRVSLTEYEKNLREFCRICHLMKIKVVFIVNHIINPTKKSRFFILGNNKRFMENLEPYNNCVKKIANDLNLDLIDIPSLTVENNINADNMLLSDGIHLNEYGYKVYSKFVADKLLKVVEDNFKK